MRANMPLAERVRPSNIDEVVGHEALIGPDSPLRQALDADRIPSMIFWGPPGSGKTTLAHVIASSTRATFVAFSAVLGGVADIRRIVAEAAARRQTLGDATVLFVDEIHRFNKSQQDAFLPHVEDGTITLVGATTENPSFALNAPLLSRCVVYRLDPLGDEQLTALLRRAVAHPRAGLNDIEVAEDALMAIAHMARGDGRRALGVMEVAIDQLPAGEKKLSLARVKAMATHSTLLYDKAGDEHYNVVSAFIKSMRGSDPDAAIYWLMRMVEAGDDPLFVLRRIVIFASEDIGNADPRALTVALAADQAFRRLGLPEGLYPLSQAVLYMASAPKSNATKKAWHAAQKAVREHGALPVPKKLRNAPTKLMKKLGYGRDYRNAHNEEGGYVAGEVYLPDKLAGSRFYHPTDRGLEAKIGAWLRGLRGP